MARYLEHVNAARDEALKLGAVLIVEQGSKHLKGIIYYKGKKRKTSFSINPSKLACHQTKLYIRRAIKEMDNGTNHLGS